MIDDARLCKCGHTGWDHSPLGCAYLHGAEFTPCNRYEPIDDD